MNAQVLKTFRDRKTKRLYKPGEIFKGTKERIAEINLHVKGPFLKAEKEGKDDE